MNNVFVKQQGIKDCGVSCMLSIIKYYGGNISVEKLREMTSTNLLGTNLFQLKQTFEKLGFSARGFSINMKDLHHKKIVYPLIAHTLTKDKIFHFVVIYKVTKGKLHIMDPAVGMIKLSFQEFEEIWTKNILVVYPLKKIPDIKYPSILNYMIKIILRDKKILINIFILSLLWTIFNIVNSFYFKIIIDHSLVNLSIYNLTITFSLFLLLAIINTTNNYCRSKLLLIINQKIDYNSLMHIVQKIFLLPYNYFKNRPTGEIISRINDLNYFRDVITKILITTLVDLILVILSLSFLYLISNKLFIISIIIFGLLIIGYYTFKAFYLPLIKIVQEKQARFTTFLIESINSYESIKGLNMTKKIMKKIEYYYASFLNNMYKLTNLNIKETLFKEIIINSGVIVNIFVGSILVIKNELSISQLITYNSLMIYFLDPIKNIVDLGLNIEYAKNSLKRVNTLFEIDIETDYKEEVSLFNGNIIFNKLCYSHNNYDYLLKNISFSITKGEKILLMGRTGCGKSTLMKILMKYYQINRQQVFINNLDLNDYSINSVRNSIGYISQNEFLYTGSIKENICLDRKIDLKKFNEICKLCEVNHINNVSKLGYDLLLEENGFNISGGERQRIILARLLLTKRNFYIIDEGLSQVDVSIERKILKNIFKQLKDKTFIIISHRHDNIDLFDKVINLDDYLELTRNKNGRIHK